MALAEAAATMAVAMTVSGSSFFYSAVAEMDSDLVATVVDATVVATTDAASYLERGCAIQPLLHISYHLSMLLFSHSARICYTYFCKKNHIY